MLYYFEFWHDHFEKEYEKNNIIHKDHIKWDIPILYNYIHGKMYLQHWCYKKKTYYVDSRL